MEHSLQTAKNNNMNSFSGQRRDVDSSKSEDRGHYEVVFLPYKASMWDSLESIWSIAKEDPYCTVHVIPIPYYERNGDRSLGKLLYEGELFPEYVHITHYSMYNIPSKHPDIIYISNPYDNGNFITSVKENYFASELKNHTDMLVYVPYFFTGGNFPEGQLNLMAYPHVDKIILQSERVKEHFINTQWYDKILPLGSPKADRMLGMEENKPAFPIEWENMASTKKVVMYNTSISSILQHGMKALQKMLYTFECFSRRKDVLLLWRPHPLTKSTLHSMRPDLLSLYEQIERIFINGKIGILDTTPDVTKSIAFSDAYLGEESSSIVHLFGITGKPSFLTNPDISQLPSEEEKSSLHFLDCYCEDNFIWFVDAGYQALCQLDVSTGKFHIVDMLPAPVNSFAYCDIHKVGNRVYMQPLNGSTIVEYEVTRRVFKQITFDHSLYHLNFSRMIPYKHYLFFVPKAYSAIVQYDTRSGEITYHSECIYPFKEAQQHAEEEMIGWGVSVKDNLLLLASSKVNQVLEFDMDTGKSRMYRVGPEGSNYFGMEFDGRNYWLIPNKSTSIIRWNYETGETWEYKDYPAGFAGDSLLFVNIICCGDFMLAFPRTSNMIVKIDIASGQMSEFQWNPPYKEGSRKSSGYFYKSNYYFAKKINENQVVALSAFDDQLCVFDFAKEQCFSIPCRLDVVQTKSMSDLAIERAFGGFYHGLPYNCREDRQYRSIDQFLDYVLNDKDENKKSQIRAYAEIINNIDGTCGEKVHYAIQQQLQERVSIE